MLHGIKQYLPSIGMVAATLLSAFYVALGDNVIDSSEWFMVTTAGLGAFTVYIVPRFTTVQWLKPVTAAATAAVQAAGAAFITSGISGQEWVVIAIQALGGLGIVLATNSEVPLTVPASSAPPRRQTGG